MMSGPAALMRADTSSGDEMLRRDFPRVSLSSASASDLDALPGIGPVTAQKIVDYRAARGGFRSVDDLDAIPGIGPAKIDQLRDLVSP